MKLKNLMLSLSLAGLCLNQASSQAFAQSGRHIGDGSVNSAEDLRPAEFRSNLSSLAASDSNVVAPTAMAYGDTLTSSGHSAYGDTLTSSGHSAYGDTLTSSGQVYFEGPISGSCSASCDGSCDGGCDSCSTRKGLLAGLEGNGNLFFSAETLLWFAPKLSLPPLVTTSQQGVLPVLPDAATAFGGPDGISYGLLPGFRVEGGMYLDDCQKFGVSGRAYGIFQGKDDFHAASNGETSIGIPFYNLNPENC